MQFDETNKVIISTMNRIEARAFVEFLHSEIARHEDDIERAKQLIEEVKTRFGL